MSFWETPVWRHCLPNVFLLNETVAERKSCASRSILNAWSGRPGGGREARREKFFARRRKGLRTVPLLSQEASRNKLKKRKNDAAAKLRRMK